MKPLHSQHTSGITESKVLRLMEMGFDRNSVEHALSANSDNEEAALNGLLSGAASDTPSQNVDAATAATAQQAQSGGGMFSRLWGK